MKLNEHLRIRSPDPDNDFEWVVALLSADVELTSAAEFRQWYSSKPSEDLHMRIAENLDGERLGYYYISCNTAGDGVRHSFNLIVAPEHRRRGVGASLYRELEEQALGRGARVITTEIRDDHLESRLFAEQRGFIVMSHDLQMVLDMNRFDEEPYTFLISGLTARGFHFTTMEELGNDEEAQRKLFELNNSVSATQPGHEGVASWGSFEDFQHQVCQMGWYKPAGQFVVIDTSTGEWIAMSAITRFEDTDHAYNLFTGVDPRYRGRKLAQAVKVLALRYAREKLGVDRVRTNHNADNAPMIAIDRKLGYDPASGTFRMRKILNK